MGFRLNVPDVRLHIEADALPGGLDAWGEGELEVLVDGTLTLAAFFDISERMAAASEAGETAEGRAAVRQTLRDFGGRIKSWTIEGIEPGADGFMALPHLLALALFGAWQRSAQPNPTSNGASASGST